jgi:3-ketosteroid 9alpha-monooxygenase subunit A
MFRNVFEGTQASQFMESTGRPDKIGEGYGDENLLLKSEATYFGPAFMVNWLKNDYKGFITDVVLINCHIPTSPTTRSSCMFGLKVLKPEGIDAKTTKYIGDKYSQMFGDGFMQDVADLAQQGPGAEPAAVRGGRAGLSACVAGTSSSTSTWPR